MALELFANNPATAVLSGGSDAPAAGTSETWTVSNGSAFPSASSTASPATQFHVADEALAGEIVAVMNVAGNNWTVTRGAEGTVPAAHASGFTVTQVVSAGAFSALAQTSQMTTAIAAETSRAEAAEAAKVTLGGDLGGTASAPVVSKIQGTVIQAPSGSSTQFLNATGGWTAPAGGSGGVQIGGDLGGTSAAPTVSKIQGTAIEAPTGGAAAYLNAAGTWTTPAGTGGGVQLAGDLGGTSASPEVVKIQGTAISAPTGSVTAYLNSAGGWTTPAGGGGSSGGTLSQYIAPEVTVLTYGSTVAVNAASGNAFNLTLTGNAAIASPINAVDGQVIRFRISQNTTGGHTVTWGTAYDFGSASAPVLSTAASKLDIVAFEYAASKGAWCYLGTGLGY